MLIPNGMGGECCMGYIQRLQREVHRRAVEKGWWGDDGKADRNLYEQVALMHSELSEAVEELRNGHAPDHEYYREDGKPEGFGVELADCVIRILDTCERYGINLEALIDEKHRFNKTRPYRHGGKAA